MHIAPLDRGYKLNLRRLWKTDGVYMNQSLNVVLNLRQGKPYNLPIQMGNLEVTIEKRLEGKGLEKKQMPNSNSWDIDFYL